MSNEIQNKLSQFEAHPSPEVWNRIAATLDEESLTQVGKRLSEFEVVPAGSIWNKIQQQLNGLAPARVVPFYKKYSRPLKYGTAVAVFATVALITSLLINKKTLSETGKPLITQEQQFPFTKNPSGTASVENTTVKAGELDIEKTPDAGNVNYHEPAKRNIAKLKPLVLGMVSSANNVIPETAERNNGIAFNNRLDKYIIYSKDDGDAVRLPRKLFDEITCPRKDVSCLLKFKTLQEKFASSALTADFTGVLDLLNNLGENQ